MRHVTTASGKTASSLMTRHRTGWVTRARVTNLLKSSGDGPQFHIRTENGPRAAHAFLVPACCSFRRGVLTGDLLHD